MDRSEPNAEPHRSFRKFVTIWFGQTVSMIGSGLTGFALAVWLFQRTGAATPMAVAALAQWLPRVVLAPLAGVVVDRRSRRLVMILADTAAALATAAAGLLALTGSLDVWHVYVIAALIGAFATFQDPAFTASVTMLVEKGQYVRAAGMRQASAALESIAAPVIAGLLIGRIGLAGVVFVDLATFAVAVATLASVRVPNPVRARRVGDGPAVSNVPGADSADGHGLQAALYGLRYIARHPGLLAMMAYFATVNFAGSMSSVLVSPLVLSFSDAAGLGMVQTTAGIGMLAGSVVISVWGGPKRRVRAIFASILLSGCGLVVAGLAPGIAVVASGLFLMMVLVPVANGSSSAIWQSKVDPAVQGRVFAARGMIAGVMMPAAFAVAGPLADRVFEPLMQSPRAPAALRAVVGSGVGRGYAVMFVIGGVMLIAATLLFWAHRPLRRVESELPDFDDGSADAVEQVEEFPLLGERDDRVAVELEHDLRRDVTPD